MPFSWFSILSPHAQDEKRRGKTVVLLDAICDVLDHFGTFCVILGHCGWFWQVMGCFGSFWMGQGLGKEDPAYNMAPHSGCDSRIHAGFLTFHAFKHYKIELSRSRKQ